MNAQQILEALNTSECYEMERESEGDLLTIWHKSFFRPTKEFVFQLNGSAVYGCRQQAAARRKIEAYINQGFQPVKTEQWQSI